MKIVKFKGIALILVLTSCVSQKKYAITQDRAALDETNLKNSQNENKLLEAEMANEKKSNQIPRTANGMFQKHIYRIIGTLIGSFNRK